MNKRVDGRSLRKIPNARQFNTKITEEFYQKIYKLAQEEGVLIKQVLEKAVNFYLESKKNKSNILSDKSKEKEIKRPATLKNETKQIIRKRKSN
ncbi:MAG: hypothetical protein mread185_000669 [Mycoplasmataceae bacterium]|nr:MAG: hypothetical protein mread185_000669 [Mycoplasmataceae bacterium]